GGARRAVADLGLTDPPRSETESAAVRWTAALSACRLFRVHLNNRGAPMSNAKMRAIAQSVLGGPEVLELIETERPEPYYGEVLVRVRAAGVNPVDPAARERGLYIGAPPFTL